MLYRTDDATRWGTGKGANLTPTEIDLNFWELAERLVAVEGGGASPNSISNITVVGSQMTVYLDDGTALGPYTLPTAMIRYRGDWVAGAAYVELDLVAVPDSGVYLVLRDHTAAATFDANAVDASGNPLYRWLFPMGGRALDDLADVSAAAPGAGEVLTWDATALAWMPKPSGGGLADAPADGNTYGRLNGAWSAIDTTVNWADIPDKPATIAGIPPTIGASGQILKVQADGTIAWAADESSGTGGATTLDGLDDVAITTPASGQLLRHDGASWINGSVDWTEVTGKPPTFPPDAHSHDWSQVTGRPATIDAIPAAIGASGNVMVVQVDGSIAWEPQSGGGTGATTLDGLDDVAVTTPAAGQSLRFDGSLWVNALLGWGDISGKPATFPPDAHTHGWSEITSRPATIDAIPATVGTDGQVLKAGAGGTIVWAADETAAEEPSTQLVTNTSTASSSSAYATKGNIYDVEQDIVLRSIDVPLPAAAGATYKMVIAKVSGATAVIDEILASTASQAAATAGTYTFDFPDVFLRGGETFAALVVRTDGTDTTVNPVYFPSVVGAADAYLKQFGSARYASIDPLVGDATMFGTGTSVRMTFFYAPEFREAPKDGQTYGRRNGTWFALPPQEGAYQYWRLRLISEDQMVSGTGTRTFLGEIEFRSAAGVTEQAAGGAIISSGWSNTGRVFDGIKSTTSNLGADAAEPYLDKYIGYDFGSPKTVREIALYSAHNLAADAPTRFVVEASNDNVTFTEIVRADPIDPDWGSDFGTIERLLAVPETSGPVDADTIKGVAPSAFVLTLLDDADAAAAQATLGLGSIATQDAGNVTITGGTLTGIASFTLFASDDTLAARPVLQLDRHSATPEAEDRLADLRWTGRNDTGAEAIYARQQGRIVDPATGAEHGGFSWETNLGGIRNDRMHLRGGLYMTGASGNDMGHGTINAQGLYVHGAHLAYEVGTFTPVIEGETTAGVGTYTTATGAYTRVGDRCHVSLVCTWSAHDGTGNLRVAGLPFVANGWAALSIYQSSLVLPFATSSALTTLAMSNQAALGLYSWDVGGGNGVRVGMDAAASLYIGGTYRI